MSPSLDDLAGGVGDCPERPGELGHIWAGRAGGDRNPCKFCGTPGRGDPRKGESGYFNEATAARSALFQGLRTPDSAKGIKPKEKTS